ncbi:MAG: phage tail assembly protein [Anaerolineales bacterium]|nr:phage tail assembly protein [Anaerolineales bacterium]
MNVLKTEFEFNLPRGYVDSDGNLHKTGAMRLATALDEIAPLRDPRVKSNQAYLVIILLSRVITRLGQIAEVTPKHVEGLFSSDLAYLQRLYRQINESGDSHVPVQCPQCSAQFEVDFAHLGGSRATP